MSFPAFGVPARDEINPHIIYNLHRESEILKRAVASEASMERMLASEIGVEPTKELLWLKAQHADTFSVLQIQKEFLEAYDKARNFLLGHKDIGLLLEGVSKVKHGQEEGQFLPLTYRLDLLTDNMTPDHKGPNHMGGVPHQLLTSRGKYDVAKVWPRCGSCHEYMIFLGEMDLTPYMWVIHHLTSSKGKEKFDRPVSGLGHSGEQEEYKPHTHKLHQMFFCPCWNHENYAPDARVLNHYMFKPLRGEERESDKDKPEEHEKIKAFIEANGLDKGRDDRGMIPEQAVTGFKIRMDLAAPEDGWRGKSCYRFGEVYDDFNENFVHDNESRTSDYSMWGEPRSQQTERRYFSSMPDKPIRMAPIINWNDDGNDITHQMYGCYRTAQMGGSFHARMDSSCT